MTRSWRSTLVAVALGACAAAITFAPRPAHAAVSMGPHGAIGGGNNFGLGGHIGSGFGPSLKFWFGGGLALNVNAGLHHYWYRGAFGVRAEAAVIWHFSVATHEKWEMLIGPGVGGGVGFWRDWWYDVCNTGTRGGAGCFGPFGKALFHWSMLFHQWKFDVFAEPGFLLGVGIPGYFFWDWDFLIGARYYF